MNLMQVFESVARRQPNKAAIVTPLQVVTYGSLADTVDRMTTALLDRNLHPGDVLGVVLGNTPDHLALLLAAARTGLVVMVVDTNWTSHEVDAVLDRFNVAVAVVDEGTIQLVTNRAAERVERIERFHDHAPYKGKPLQAVSADAPYLLMLSSGTTGQPKGAVVMAGAMAFRFLAQVVTFGLTANDVYLSCMSLQAGGGRSFSLSHLYLGGTVVLPPKFNAAEADALIRTHQVTNTVMVPTMLHRLLDLPDASPWPSVRVLLSSGSRLASPERNGIRTRFTANLWDYYASVEAGGISVSRPEDIESNPGSVGRPMWGTEVQIRTADLVAGPGEHGEIFYRSPGMASGYRGGDSSAFQAGWYQTGDVGTIDDEGFLSITGRSKEMIVTGGVNVYTAEIEAALTSFAGIRRAAVVGVGDAEWGERVVAVVETTSPVDSALLESHLRHLLAGPKRPKEVYIMDLLPTTTADKIDRHALMRTIHGTPLTRLV